MPQNQCILKTTKAHEKKARTPRYKRVRKEVPVNPFPSPHIQDNYLPECFLVEMVRTCLPKYVNNLGLE